MEAYEKVYCNDTYQDVFAQFRDRYSERVQNALKGRKVDEAPVPNATTIVYLHDDPGSGEVTITGTGDFVTFFNRRCGHDRIGAAQRALANAASKAERRNEVAERRGQPKEQPAKQPAGLAVRSVRPRFVFAQVIFAMLLVLSFGLLGITSAMLDNTNATLAEVSAEVEVLEAERDERAAALAAKNEAADIYGLADEYGFVKQESKETELALEGVDSVEIYPVEKKAPMAAILNALASLWN